MQTPSSLPPRHAAAGVRAWNQQSPSRERYRIGQDGPPPASAASDRPMLLKRRETGPRLLTRLRAGLPVVRERLLITPLEQARSLLSARSPLSRLPSSLGGGRERGMLAVLKVLEKRRECPARVRRVLVHSYATGKAPVAHAEALSVRFFAQEAVC